MSLDLEAKMLDNGKVRMEILASFKLELIHKLTSEFMDWNDCKHEEYNTGYMNCLIDTVNALSEVGE